MLKLVKALLVGLSMTVFGVDSGNVQSSVVSAAGTEYYVAIDGSDSNPGTIRAPWKTLQHAADKADPGSMIYVRDGVYNQKLKITRSGTASQGPITFTSYGSEKPIMDGTGLSVNGIEGLIEITDVSYITIQGLEIRNYATSFRNAVPVGIYVQGSGGFINLSNNKIHDIQST
ncbi:DUF1565 domain-containing protein, partial [Yersinia pestis]|nr:DUF1565 domain-containing protein [Yersinia pestis]